MILGRVVVGEGLVAEPVGERVDAEGRVVDEHEARRARKEISALENNNVNIKYHIIILHIYIF